MPSKNTIKTYVNGGYYHIYNRGVEKRNIFEDQQDYRVLLSYLKEYLSEKDTQSLQAQMASKSINWIQKDKILKLIKLNNFHEHIKLLVYCLMPNHFHFVINQTDAYSIDSFINSLNTRYVMYFNKKYNRVGPLFQGVYKAILIKTDEQLLYLSAYVHKNPAENKGKALTDDEYINRIMSQPSSLTDYLGITNTPWIYKEEILSSFNNNSVYNSYRKFILGCNRFGRLDKDVLIDDSARPRLAESIDPMA